MNNKSLYWILLAVFALALHGQYQKGYLPLAHQVADRAQSVFCNVATKAEQTWALARVLTGRQELPADGDFLARQQAEIDRVIARNQAELERVLARRQADLNRMQARLDRVHMVMDRAQQSKGRELQFTRVKVANFAGRNFVACPQSTRVTVDGQPDVVVAVDVDNEQ